MANPDWRWAEGLTVTEAADRGGHGPGRLRLREPRGLGHGRRASSASAPATGPRPTSARSSATPRTWPGSDGIFRRRLPPPPRLGRLRPLPRLPHPPARRLHLGRGRHPPGHPRRAPLPADRPRPDPPRLRRRHRHLRPRHRRPTARPTPPAGPWPKGSTTSWSTAPSSSRTASRPAPPRAGPATELERLTDEHAPVLAGFSPNGAA